jgi:hypothetical protein
VNEKLADLKMVDDTAIATIVPTLIVQDDEEVTQVEFASIETTV